MTIFILSAWEESSYDTWTWESRWDLVLRWEASCGAATWTVKGSSPLCLRKPAIDAVALSLFAWNCFYPGAVSPKLCLSWRSHEQSGLGDCRYPWQRQLSPVYCLWREGSRALDTVPGEGKGIWGPLFSGVRLLLLPSALCFFSFLLLLI